MCLNPNFGNVRNGSTVRNVGTPKAMLFGGTVRNNDAIENVAAAVRMGGDAADQRAECWIVGSNILASGSTLALRADGFGSIYKQALGTVTGGESVGGDGIIADF